MTALAEARWATTPTTNFKQQKRLSRLTNNRRKSLYQAVFATPSSRRTARTATWNCINLGKIIDPACGSGSLLLNFAQILGRENVRVLSKDITCLSAHM